MSKRVTIMLHDELVKKVRKKQAKLVKTEKCYVSLSRVINDVIRGGL